jgi:hypothetical protein
MLSAEFETAIRAIQRPQADVLDRMVIGHSINTGHGYLKVMPPDSFGEVKKYPELRVCPLDTGKQHFLTRNCYGREKITKQKERNK